MEQTVICGNLKMILVHRQQRNCLSQADIDGAKTFWAGIFERVWGPGIDSKEWIPPAYVAWRAGTITLFLLGA